MSAARKEGDKQRSRSDSGTEWDDTPLDPLDATFVELCLLAIVVLSLGLALALRKRRDTSKSYIHRLFKPLDLVLSRPPNFCSWEHLCMVSTGRSAVICVVCVRNIVASCNVVIMSPSPTR